MARPVTLFTGQWADLPIDEMARLAQSFGYDGIELACWGDHFEVEKSVSQRTIAMNEKRPWKNTA
jgi:sugar phosphate isomerase/epimerase